MNYRKDINGIRAIAIVGIILFHLNVNYFQGAIICIDIFFVLSGYLITQVILNKENNFDIFLFWVQRARRVIPLLLLVVLISIPFALYFMTPSNLSNHLQSVILTPIFFSNLLFWLESGYWDAPSQMKPLLHTWSIAIEGQFYFLFPLIFLIKNKKKVFITITLIWLISLLITIFHESKLLIIQTDKFLSLADHFMPFGRWWQLMSGAFVAFFFKYNNNSSPKLNNLISIFGLSLLFISIFSFNNNYKFPGPLSLIPVFGTTLILLYSKEGNFVYKFLNLKILDHIGEISYSLYLWHFPILVYLKYSLGSDLNVGNKIFIILLTYVLSLITYKYVEKPFYKKKILSTKVFLILIIIFITITSFLGLYINSNKETFSRLAHKTEMIKKNFSKYSFGVSEPYTFNINRNFSKNLDTINILIIGDSHGRDLTRALISNKKNKKKYEFSFLTTKILESYANNNQIKPEHKSRIDDSNYILLSRQFTSEKNQIKRISKIGNFVKSLEKFFVIVGSTPEFYTSEGDVLLTFLLENEKNKEYLINKNFEFINKYYYKKLKTHLFDINNVLRNLAKDLDVLFLDRFEYTCDLEKKSCYAFNFKNKKNFFDYSHYTKSGMKFFGNKIYDTNWLENVVAH